MGGCKEDRTRLFSVTRGNGNKLKYRKCLLKNSFYCKGGGTWEQIAQRGCEVSVLGDGQNLTVHSAGQPAPADSTLSTEAGLDNFQSSLPHSETL